MFVKTLYNGRRAFYLYRNKTIPLLDGLKIEQKSDSEVVLSVVIQPQRKGATYTLDFTYEIPPEILITRVRVRVS